MSVTVKVLDEYEIVKGTGLFDASRSNTVEVVKLAELSGSENVTAGATLVETPVAPAAGVTATTSGGAGSMNNTSTQ